MNNPWKKKSKKKIYENNWLQLNKYEVTDPGGNDTEYSVLHYKQLAVGCIPVDEQGNIYLVGQWRFPFDEYSWEIPAGGASFDVDPVEECKRELVEEAGITAKDWLKIMEFYPSNSITDEKVFIYVCKDLDFGKPQPESCEDITVRKIKFEEALKLVYTGEIKDALTVASILKLAVMTKTYL